MEWCTKQATAESIFLTMVGTPRLERGFSLILRTKTAKKARTIVVGLKSHNCSREMLLRVLTLVVAPGDNVVVIHVQEPFDTFNPNNFNIHEDLCKSKQVDFQVKVCTGSSSISVLTHQAILHSATMLVVGCRSSRPKDSFIFSCLKSLNPTCSLLVMDTEGRILVEKTGYSKHHSAGQAIQPSHPSSSNIRTWCVSGLNINHQCLKSLLKTSPKTSPISSPTRDTKTVKQHPDTQVQKHFQKLALIESKGASRRFTRQELEFATDKFNPQLMIGESGHSKVYKANIRHDQIAAVKVLKITQESGEELLQEVEMLSGLNHQNIVQLIGYCYSKNLLAVVYNLLEGSLEQNLTRLRWGERLRVAIGIAKALEYLHHSCSPPIIHRDVKSSNILLSHKNQPRLSDFGTAMVNFQPQQRLPTTKPVHVIGTFGYLAPEYMMYGKIDEKIDVYSYGVVLLELITGKEAIQKNKELKYESLVLWARSLLSHGLCERLIDPNLYEEYDKEEMQRMMFTARLCLSHSSSRRPSMTMILKLLDEPEYWVKMRRERDEFIKGSAPKGNHGCKNMPLDFKEQ